MLFAYKKTLSFFCNKSSIFFPSWFRRFFFFADSTLVSLYTEKITRDYTTQARLVLSHATVKV